MSDQRFDTREAVRLTARQSACIALVAEGKSSKEIARELGISPSTVDNHIATAMNLYGFTNRNAVARWYLEYRESMSRTETGERQGNAAQSAHLNVRIPSFGGIRNSLSVKERLLALLQVMIISIMVVSSGSAFVLGLIFLLKLAR